MQNIKQTRPRRYIARDFDSFKASFIEHARVFYPDRIKDFSDASIAAMFTDMVASAGDSLSFYMDHQYNELDASTAVEQQNIERHIRAAGVDVIGASPAVVPLDFYVEIPAVVEDGEYVPDIRAIPIISEGSTFSSDSGVTFTLMTPVAFVDDDNELLSTVDQRIGTRTSTGVVTTFILKAQSTSCVSGTETTETFSIGSTFIPFRKIVLTNPHVSDIVSVTDSDGNIYYQVDALTSDVVYQNVANGANDHEEVPELIKIIPAPYRFTAQANITTRRVELTFGGGSSTSLEDDVLPDPTDFAISLPYKKTFTRTALNPQSLLTTKTLGVAATGVSLTVVYRHGGGLDHNVPANSIRTVQTLNMQFPHNPTPAVASVVRKRLTVSNPLPARGGDDAPTIVELKNLIPAAKSAQKRIVSKPDLLARLYNMPTNFGRIFRAGIRQNPDNSLAIQLFIVSRNIDGQLTYATDTLKQNIVKYISPYRMINDAIDILDAKIINVRVLFDIVVNPVLNKHVVLQNVLNKLKDHFNIKNFHIDQPINITEVRNIIERVNGVLSVNDLKFEAITEDSGTFSYSRESHDITSNTSKGFIFPPQGGIFEVKYPNVDMIGRAS